MVSINLFVLFNVLFKLKTCDLKIEWWELLLDNFEPKHRIFKYFLDICLLGAIHVVINSICCGQVKVKFKKKVEFKLSNKSVIKESRYFLSSSGYGHRNKSILKIYGSTNGFISWILNLHKCPSNCQKLTVSGAIHFQRGRDFFTLARNCQNSSIYFPINLRNGRQMCDHPQITNNKGKNIDPMDGSVINLFLMIKI